MFFALRLNSKFTFLADFHEFFRVFIKNSICQFAPFCVFARVFPCFSPSASTSNLFKMVTFSVLTRKIQLKMEILVFVIFVFLHFPRVFSCFFAFNLNFSLTVC